MKYLSKKVAFLLFLLLISLSVGCDPSIDSLYLSHTIFFETQSPEYIHPIRVTHMKPVIQPNEPIKRGYEFTGWHTNSSATQLWDFSSPVTRNTRLYAGWSPINYTITYNLHGGELPSTYPTMFTIDSDAQHLPIPKKMNYGFSHWYDGDQSVVTIETGSIGDRILNAVWQSDSFSLFLVTEKEAYRQYPLEIVPPNPFAIAGFRFIHWYDENNNIYEENDTLTDQNDLILYARWEAIGYTVAFNTQDGGTFDPIPVTFGEPYGLLPTPEKEGHDFLGWYYEETRIDELSIVSVSSDHVLEAKYLIQERTVTFDSKEGSPVTSGVVGYGTPIEEPSPPNRVGWAFMGWYVDETYNEVWDFSQEITNNITLYAKWAQLFDVPSSIDVGIWLDGVPGNWVDIAIETEELITPALFGSHAHLFEVTCSSHSGQSILSIRYKGEADPLSISEKKAFLALHSQIGVHTIELVAKPTIDEVWSLHMLLNTDQNLEEVYELMKHRSYAQAILGQGILSVLQFAQGSDSEHIAQRAYNALTHQSLDNNPLILSFRGTAAAFLASKKGASGASELDAMQTYFQQIPHDSAHWVPLYWKGVTYLRTAQGIRDNWLAWNFGGYQKRIREIWEPEGRAALDLVKQHYLAHALTEGTMDGFSYDRETSPVPQEIVDDIKTVKNYSW